MNLGRYFMLGVALCSVGTIIAAGCDDDDTTSGSGGSGNTGNTANGGNGNTGNTGNMGGTADCTPNTECENCAASQCMDQALACCMAAGCQELVLCVATNCADAADQTVCALQNCSQEIEDAGGATGPGVAAAQDLGECITPVLENPPDCPSGPCAACPEENGQGGSNCGGAGGN